MERTGYFVFQSRASTKEEPMPEIMDGTTIAAVFAAAVADHADRPFLAVPANEERGYLPAGFEITYGEAGRQDRGTGGDLPPRGLWRRPSRRDASGEPARACPAHAGAQQHRRLLRADQSGLPPGRDRLSRRPQRARSRPVPGRATGLDRAGAGAQHPPAACGRVGVVRWIVGARVTPGARHASPFPRRPPASSTRPARPAGPRAAC